MNNQLLKTVIYFTLYSVLSITATVTYAQTTVNLLATEENDLSASRLIPTINRPLINQSRDDVSISWPLKPDLTLSETSKTFKASSKAYWLTVGGKQIQQGLKIQTTAPGAIIKLSPKPNENARTDTLPELDASQLTIIDPQGKQHSQKSALARSATATQLNKAGVSFSPGTLILQLDKTLGHGEFTLKYKDINNIHQAYHVYVLDKDSHYSLSLQTKDDTLFYGSQLHAQIALKANQKNQQINSIETYLLSPDGEKIIVDTHLNKNGMTVANAVIDSPEDTKTGLWELHTMTTSRVNGVLIQRNAKTTFAYNHPNAALSKTVVISKGVKPNNELTLTFAVDAVSVGRFELRGTLYGTDINGKNTPMMFANSAGWREAGKSTLNLTFDLNKLPQANLKPPFEIRDLRLLDQSRMMLLHRQKTALRFH